MSEFKINICADALEHYSNPENFPEKVYVSYFRDVAFFVASQLFISGFDHFVKIGKDEIAQGKRENIFSKDILTAIGSRDNYLSIYNGSKDDFFEELYLTLNKDVADACASGQISSGADHWNSSGWYEARDNKRLVNFAPTETDTLPYAGQPEAIELFQGTKYLEVNSDVRVAGYNPENAHRHWLSNGRYERRIGPGLPRKSRRSFNLKNFTEKPNGFNIFGAFSTISGLGTAARSIAYAVKKAGFDFELLGFSLDNDFKILSHQRNKKLKYNTNLIIANADQMLSVFAAYEDGFFNDAFNIALWHWEFSAFRPDWFYEFEGLDEVWTTSEFQRKSISSISPVRVRNIPLPIYDIEPQQKKDLAYFGLPESKFTFLISFDTGSTLERKNPMLAIRAFSELCTKYDNIHLVVKYHGANAHKEFTELMQRQSIQATRITVISGKIDYNAMHKLYNACDCLISPHRSEGFGLQIAEFMALGKPVIATNYSGNIDFFDAEVGFPINYDLVELAASVGSYRKGFLWAEPRLTSLIEQMELVLNDTDEVEKRSALARKRVRQSLSFDAIAEKIKNFVSELNLYDINANRLPQYLLHNYRDLKSNLDDMLPPSDGGSEMIDKNSPTFSIVMPVYNVPSRYLEKCINSIVSQTYPLWELCICNDASTNIETLDTLNKYRGKSYKIKIVDNETNLGIADATNAAIHLATGDYVLFVDNDDLLETNAIERIANAYHNYKDYDIYYTDEIKIDENGQEIDHFFKPDWSPEHLESVMYVLHMVAVKKQFLLKIGLLRPEYDGAQDYDFMLRCSRLTQRIYHIQECLYSWRAIPGSAAAVVDAKPTALVNGQRALSEHVHHKYGGSASVEPGLLTGTFRVRRPLPRNAEATLLILTAAARKDLEGRGSVLLVENFLRSIYEKTDFKNFRVVVIDDSRLNMDEYNRIAKYGAEVVNFHRGSSPFNFSKKANFAINYAQTENIVLLNDDMEVIRNDWLTSLLELSNDPSIGAVGARLLHENKTVQHAGVVVGVNGGATHIYHSYPEDFVGYNGFTHLIRNYSAVTAACLATRRSIVQEVGGFDEGFAVDYNDIDFCLKIINRGYRIAYTPYAELFHFESASAQRTSQNPEEVERFISKWGDYIRNDPYYNHNLTRHGVNFARRS